MNKKYNKSNPFSMIVLGFMLCGTCVLLSDYLPSWPTSSKTENVKLKEFHPIFKLIDIKRHDCYLNILSKIRLTCEETRIYEEND